MPPRYYAVSRESPSWTTVSSWSGVWRKENGGVSSARNLGICKAEGEYLFFTDSDDTLFPDTLATLYQKAKVSGADLSVCGFTYLVEQTKECVDNLPEKAFCGGGKEYLEERFLSDFRREFRVLFLQWQTL